MVFSALSRSSGCNGLRSRRLSDTIRPAEACGMMMEILLSLKLEDDSGPEQSCNAAQS